MNQSKLFRIYSLLLEWYGPQGWFPLLRLHDTKGVNPTKTGSINGYHPGDYSYPKNRTQQFEICIGCILTQNTSWPNVERALMNLSQKKMLSPNRLLSISIDELKQAIRPAGYYNQKANYLLSFTSFFNSLKKRNPLRREVLDVKGIGNETADAILLYAFKKPEFVVDAYCRRIFENHGLISPKDSYVQIKEYIESELPRDIVVYQEFHALLVEHAKRYYRKGTEQTDPLSQFINR